MAKIENTTRAALVDAAADLHSGDDLPFWDRSEYMRGMCELIALATGADDPENAKSEAWGEIVTAREAADLRRRAEEIARATYEGHVPQFGDPTPDEIRAALTAAALAALNEKEA